MAGELGDDRSERVGEVGAEDEVGEADLFPSPLELLGGGRRIGRKEASESAWRAAAVSVRGAP